MYGGGGHPDIGRLILEKLKPIFGQVENEDSSITCIISLQEFLGFIVSNASGMLVFSFCSYEGRTQRHTEK